MGFLSQEQQKRTLVDPYDASHSRPNEVSNKIDELKQWLSRSSIPLYFLWPFLFIGIGALIAYGVLEAWTIYPELDGWWYVLTCPMGQPGFYLSQNITDSTIPCPATDVGPVAQNFTITQKVFEEYYFKKPTYYLVAFLASNATHLDYKITHDNGVVLAERVRHFDGEDNYVVCSEGQRYVSNYTNPCPDYWTLVGDESDGELGNATTTAPSPSPSYDATDIARFCLADYNTTSNSTYFNCSGGYVCTPPPRYTGPCGPTMLTGGEDEKEDMEFGCDVSWPVSCLQLGNSTSDNSTDANEEGSGLRRMGRHLMKGGGGGASTYGGSTYVARSGRTYVGGRTWVWVYGSGGSHYRRNKNSEYEYNCDSEMCEVELQTGLIRYEDKTFTFKESDIKWPMEVYVNIAYGVEAEDVFFTFGTDDDYDNISGAKTALLVSGIVTLCTSAILLAFVYHIRP